MSTLHNNTRYDANYNENAGYCTQSGDFYSVNETKHKPFAWVSRDVETTKKTEFVFNKTEKQHKRTDNKNDLDEKLQRDYFNSLGTGSTDKESIRYAMKNNNLDLWKDSNCIESQENDPEWQYINNSRREIRSRIDAREAKATLLKKAQEEKRTAQINCFAQGFEAAKNEKSTGRCTKQQWFSTLGEALSKAWKALSDVFTQYAKRKAVSPDNEWHGTTNK